jgi:hypothetical protein
LLLLALYFLKKYPTKHGLAAFLYSTEKTTLGWVWRYIITIQALKENKVRALGHPSSQTIICSYYLTFNLCIKWVFDNLQDYPEMYIIIVDGIHC